MLFPRLEREEVDSLNADVLEQEVRSSLFNIGGLKAPGPDGFPALFFQKNWKVCKQELVNLVEKAFRLGCIPDQINQTYISLIPKIPNPSSLSQFRPISLYSTSYKVLSKVIVARLRILLPNLISPNQVAFVPGRHIHDNIVVA